MHEHFAEQRLFAVGGFERVHEAVQAGFTRTFLEFGHVKNGMGELEQRMDGLERRMDRLESKLDTYLTTVLDVLRDIQRRLPPGM